MCVIRVTETVNQIFLLGISNNKINNKYRTFVPFPKQDSPAEYPSTRSCSPLDPYRVIAQQRYHVPQLPLDIYERHSVLIRKLQIYIRDKTISENSEQQCTNPSSEVLPLKSFNASDSSRALSRTSSEMCPVRHHR